MNGEYETRKSLYGFWSGFWTGLGAIAFIYSVRPQTRLYPNRNREWSSHPRLVHVMRRFVQNQADDRI
ncbi:hypothetical protein CCP2SC5_280023 [Azospirillaceae bacterium]